MIDPISAKRINPNDIQRLLRALEVFLISGSTLTELTQFKSFTFPYNVIQFALIPENKEKLLNNIEIRFKKMLSCGFEYEVKELFNRGNLNRDLPSMRCVGYRQMWDYITHRLSYSEMINETLKATKRLSKSQLTWLKNWKNINILNCDDTLDALVMKVISIINSNIFFKR